MDKLCLSNYNNHDPIDRIIQRQLQRKKTEEKNNLDFSGSEEIEKFTEAFNQKQKEIEKEFELAETLDHEMLSDHFSNLNELIQSLQKFYSNATIFLRIYDKKVCQATLQNLQIKLKELENRLLPRKKFGFKSRINKLEKDDRKKKNGTSIKNGVESKISLISHNDKLIEGEICGFRHKNDEILFLTEEEIEKKDVSLANLKNCTVKLYGNPTTIHMTNLINCQIYSGPVTTSVFVEKVKNSSLHLACQQLRIHETTDTDFHIHVTSKAIIEDSQNVRFGVYNFNYEGLENHYKISGLSKEVNNWNKVDDFNWLAADKPSPNWTILTD